jgi:hypothetical protein
MRSIDLRSILEFMLLGESVGVSDTSTILDKCTTSACCTVCPGSSIVHDT